jgi:hypothetical protein
VLLQCAGTFVEGLAPAALFTSSSQVVDKVMHVLAELVPSDQAGVTALPALRVLT